MKFRNIISLKYLNVRLYAALEPYVLLATLLFLAVCHGFFSADLFITTCFALFMFFACMFVLCSFFYLFTDFYHRSFPKHKNYGSHKLHNKFMRYLYPCIFVCFLPVVLYVYMTLGFKQIAEHGAVKARTLGSPFLRDFFIMFFVYLPFCIAFTNLLRDHYMVFNVHGSIVTILKYILSAAMVVVTGLIPIIIIVGGSMF